MRPSGARAGWARPLAAALAVACLQAPAAAAAGGLTGPALSLTPSTRELQAGSSLSLTGSVAAQGAQRVLLQSSPYPYRGFRSIAATDSASDGSFAFTGVKLDRDTRLRVILESSPADASMAVSVIVDPVAVLRSQSLGPGRVRLSMRVVHAAGNWPGSVPVSWFLASSPSELFTLAAVSVSREVAPGVSEASAIVDPPSRRFAFRVCLNPPWEAAMGAPATHGSCPVTAFRLRGHD